LAGINSTQSLRVSSVPKCRMFRHSVRTAVHSWLCTTNAHCAEEETWTNHFQTRHVRPLQLSLLEGLDKRFGSLFTDKSFLLAAVSHPKFKIVWCHDPAIRAQCTQLQENDILNTDNDITLNTPDATSSPVRLHSDTDSSQCSDDFFDFTNADASSQKHLLYLNDRDVRMLDRHPEVGKLFIKYNTAIA